VVYLRIEILLKVIYHIMQLGHSGIVVYIFLIFLKMSFLELGHFGNTLHNLRAGPLRFELVSQACIIVTPSELLTSISSWNR